MTESEKIKGPSTFFFYAATALYLAAVVAGAWKLGYFNPDGTPLHPNEWGDVLAGVFSPLAFLWLVYASLSQRAELAMQREELSQNNRTQDAQRGEMERQASALSAQIRRLEAEANAKYEPIIVLSKRFFRANGSGIVAVILENVGGTALNVHFSDNVLPKTITSQTSSDANRGVRMAVSHWKPGELLEFDTTVSVNETDDFEFTVDMRRLDGLSTMHTYKVMNGFSTMILFERITDIPSELE